MTKKSKSKEVQNRAWSKQDWIELGRITPAANRDKIKNIMVEFQRAILPKTTANIRLTTYGEAFWENITTSEYEKIETARIIWGLKKEKLAWSREHEILALRVGLRLWKYKSDNLIINVLADRAAARKKWLVKQLNELNQNKVWEKLGVAVNERLTVLDNISNYNLNQAELSIIKRWKPIIEELEWKQKQTVAIKKWIERNPHISETSGLKWIEAWSYQAS